MAERSRGEATVVAAQAVRRGGQADDGESYWWQDLGSAAFGKTPWDLVLDVVLPGSAPYRAEIRTKRPNRLFGVRGFLEGEIGLSPGLVLPVLVDPSDRSQVEVDWKAFGDRRGAREQQRATSDAARSAQATSIAAAELRKKPDRFDKNRAIVLDAAAALAAGVVDGTRDPADLEAILATNVPLGLITPEEADAFRRSATEPRG